MEPKTKILRSRRLFIYIYISPSPWCTSACTTVSVICTLSMFPKRVSNCPLDREVVFRKDSSGEVKNDAVSE